MSYAEIIMHSNENNLVNQIYERSKKLIQVAELSLGLSGRSLRKMSVLAHALHLSADCVSLDEYLDAMHKAVVRHKNDAQQLCQNGLSTKNVTLN